MLENNVIGSWYYSNQELEKFEFKHLGKNVLIKKNVTIFNPSNLILEDNVRIEDFVLIVASGEVGIKLASNVFIGPYSCLFGRAGIDIGEFSGLAPHVNILSASDDYSGRGLVGLTVPSELRGSVEGKVIIDKHVVVGVNSTVLPGVRIHEGTAVGAHSLVHKDLLGWGIYMGNPIRYIKKRERELINLEEKYKAGNSK